MKGLWNSRKGFVYMCVASVLVASPAFAMQGFESNSAGIGLQSPVAMSASALHAKKAHHHHRHHRHHAKRIK